MGHGAKRWVTPGADPVTLAEAWDLIASPEERAMHDALPRIGDAKFRLKVKTIGLAGYSPLQMDGSTTDEPLRGYKFPGMARVALPLDSELGDVVLAYVQVGRHVSVTAALLAMVRAYVAEHAKDVEKVVAAAEQIKAIRAGFQEGGQT